MCKAKLHLKSPCLHRGGWGGKEEDGTPSQLLSSEQQGSQAVALKGSVRYAASVCCGKPAMLRGTHD